jgi:hypothetical protein
MDRLATIASGEMYPEWGISWRERLTRSVVDKSSFPNPGNGMPAKYNDCRHGADPPKNESGSTCDLSSFDEDERLSVFSTGNGSFVAKVPNNELGTP